MSKALSSEHELLNGLETFDAPIRNDSNTTSQVT